MEKFIALLGVSSLSAFLVIFVLWLCKNWFLTRLTESIKHDYSMKLEEYKYNIEIRRKAEQVAKLLALWIERPLEREELNRLTFECFLWLPDDIAQDLSKLFNYQEEDSITIRSVLFKIRQHLLKESEDNQKVLKDFEIIVFSKK
ncbi:hypothetical protein H0S56_04505 [Acinetobacter lwoffii]|uniref:hypothetical protein n=2 Tax=Acinetobacter TaxID=469 RepID=UPI0018A086D3|nr:hypothetical protein [Acinetobacter lwoffii]QPF32915.1 hypothetical protein H0S56_04505 [Acinetobacter lwoffii]